MKSPSTKDARPRRDDLGPTGPKKMPPDAKDDADKNHPHPGNVGGEQVGPSPTDDPRGKASEFETEIDKRRVKTPPD